jgi:hypothetical protein
MLTQLLRETINSGLLRATGYELHRPHAVPAAPRADNPRQVRRLERRIAALQAANARLRRHGVAMPRRLAERTLRALDGVELDRLSLTDIANLEGTDKGTVGPSPEWPAHNYTDVYEAYLAPLRHQPITILEIGLGVPGDSWEARIAHGRNQGGGGSVRMWYGYFPHAQIYGADINPAQHLDNDRIQTFVLDQGDPEAIATFLNEIGDVEFDLIVDDGSHKPDHQQVSLGCLFPRLRSGGLYIIEDLLKNGKGDGRDNRMSSDEVLNTRRVLKHFRRHGRFEEPHAIVEPDYVAAHVDGLNFHVPGRRWAPDTEAVCVIRKS